MNTNIPNETRKMMCQFPELPVISFFCTDHDKWCDSFPHTFPYDLSATCPQCRGDLILKRIERRKMERIAREKKEIDEQAARKTWAEVHKS